MKAQYLQNLRYKLQKRFRRLNAADASNFSTQLKVFWTFFDSVPQLRAVVEELTAREGTKAAEVAATLAGNMTVGETEGGAAAIGYGVLRGVPQKEGHAFWKITHRGNAQESLDAFRSTYLEPFYEYVDEHLDDHSFVLAALVRFKRWCEWFRRDELFARWNEDKTRGEKILAHRMYEYLHEEGIELHIEPWSASGEADLVALQRPDDPLVADAKVFNPDESRGLSYIKKGFRQLYAYTCDYNEPVGYLVIFNTSPASLRFALGEAGDLVPRVTLNHKTVFLLTIDLYPHAESASKRKAPKEYELTEEGLTAGAALPEASAPGAAGGAVPTGTAPESSPTSVSNDLQLRDIVEQARRDWLAPLNDDIGRVRNKQNVAEMLNHTNTILEQVDLVFAAFSACSKQIRGLVLARLRSTGLVQFQDLVAAALTDLEEQINRLADECRAELAKLFSFRPYQAVAGNYKAANEAKVMQWIEDEKRSLRLGLAEQSAET